MKNIICSLLLLAVVVPAAPCAADDTDVLTDLKCFMMPKRSVKGKKVFDYKGAKLYLCCSSCVKRMTKTPEKYEAKANHQLVLTGQFVQAACPLSGDAVAKDSPMLEINGAKVMFSSADHKDKVAKLELAEQIETVFGAKGFKAGKFALKKES
ncbi:MAG: hypothetical protein AAF802_24805 [Planctomycetota bacterium]